MDGGWGAEAKKERKESTLVCRKSIKFIFSTCGHVSEHRSTSRDAARSGDCRCSAVSYALLSPIVIRLIPFWNPTVQIFRRDGSHFSGTCAVRGVADKRVLSQQITWT